MTIYNLIVSLIAGFLGSIGIGGGSVLIIYLTLFCNMSQLKAQGINLVFFIPCAVTGLIFHFRNKLVDFKKAIPLIIFGVIGVIAGFYISKNIDERILKKIFGAFLIILAAYQVFTIKRDKKSSKKPNNK